MLHVLLVLLHALLAIVWLGLSLRLQFQVRLATDASVPGAVVATGSRTVQMMTIAIILFYAVAVGAFFTPGGFTYFSEYPAFHAALGLGLALVLVQVLMLQPAWARLAGGEGSAAKRVSMSIGIAHALWLVLFVLMFLGPRWQGQWAV